MASRFQLPFADVGSGISPSDGAKLEFFESGTGTQKDTFSDEALTPGQENANPVIANGNGVFPDIWLPDGGRYKVTLDDKNIVQKWEADPVVSGISPTLIAKTFDVAADMVASTELNIGDIVETVGYLAKGDDGSNRYEIVAAATGTADAMNFIDLTGSSLQAKALFSGRGAHSLQSGSATATIFVSTTGSDANPGFIISSPFLTLQKAFDTLTAFGGVLSGTWVIEMAAGTYTAGAAFDSFTRSDFPVDINGPDVGGHPNVPTAIIDGTSAPSGEGIKVVNEGSLRVSDVKVINFSSGNAFEINAGRLSLTNCHTDNCQTACVSLHLGFVSVRGGDWDGNGLANSVGYSSFYNVTHDFIQSSNDTATDALLIHDFDRGMLINEGTQGHLDNVNILDCTGSGLNIKRGAGAVNTKTMKIDGCAIGVLAENTAWFDNGIVYGSISANTIPIKTLGNSPELIRRTSTFEFLGDHLPALNLPAHTGTTSITTVWSPDTLPKEFMSQDGHTIWGEMEINISNVSAVDSRVTLSFGSTALAFIDIPNAETSVIIKFRVVILDKSASNNVISTIQYFGRAGTTDYTPALDTLDFSSADRQFNVRFTLGGTSDSMTTRLAVYGTTVGG